MRLHTTVRTGRSVYVTTFREGSALLLLVPQRRIGLRFNSVFGGQPFMAYVLITFRYHYELVYAICRTFFIFARVWLCLVTFACIILIAGIHLMASWVSVARTFRASGGG